MVLAPKFADIFRGNSGKQGLVAGQMSHDDVEQLWKLLENDPGVEVTVDLVERLVTCGSFTAPFQVDDYTRWRLMEGLDDIGLTLRSEAEIDAFETTRPAHKPLTLPARS